MLIKYYGHACFKVRDSETGYSIVLDPYEPGSVQGFGNIKDTASEVICSHEHFDHNSRESVRLEPMEDSPFEVTAIDTWHDEVKGAKRGPNRITVITEKNTGKKLIHYGDIGVPAEELMKEDFAGLLKDADIALIPVGGTYTIDADGALDLIEMTQPKIAVPMHFRSADMGFGLPNIGSIEDFIGKAQNAGHKVMLTRMWFFDTDGEDPGRCILAVRPENVVSEPAQDNL